MEPALPSSTPMRSSDAIFSDDVARQRESSPPSSPPGFPWELQKGLQLREENAPSSPVRKSAFSVLGKRKALGTVSDNARPTKQPKPAKTTSKPLTQMQMSLGQKVQTKCKQCGMEYVVSSAEDRKLHDKFHKQNAEGYDVGKTFISSTPEPRYRLFKGVKEEDRIVVVDCRDHYHRRKRGQAVLDIVQRELGAVPIPGDDIWDEKRQNDFEVVDGIDDSRYRALLYVRGTKCVGFLLAEKIREAFRVEAPPNTISKKKEPDKPTETKTTNALEALKARKQAAEAAKQALTQSLLEADTQPLQLSSTKHPAILGISRIWTSPTHRGEGIARCLIDTAIKAHNLRQSADTQLHESMLRKAESARTEEEKAGFEILAKLHGKMPKIERKTQVAFSQPTDSGAKLARRWFGRPYGWGVYVD